MFVSEQLVFVHLQKTGGTHISSLLGKLLPGEKRKEHPQVPPELRSRFIVGSMRNPWDWYVSLWAYGCGGKGSVHFNVTQPMGKRHLLNQLPQKMGVAKLTEQQQAACEQAEAGKPIDLWESCYRNPKDPNQFRQWLRLMFDPDRRFDLREGYGLSPLSERFGLLSYRHFQLQSNIGEHLYLDQSLASLDGLRAAWDCYPLLGATIRTETLARDLVAALEQAGLQLSDSQRELIADANKKPKNRSQRAAAANYYDDASKELVAQHEAFIIEQYGYQFPTT